LDPGFFRIKGSSWDTIRKGAILLTICTSTISTAERVRRDRREGGEGRTGEQAGKSGREEVEGVVVWRDKRDKQRW
jgi:hypothetical protein